MSLEEQPIPERSNCPTCGKKPTEESIDEAAVLHRLSDLGYLHDDISLQCEDGHQWTCGVPIGQIEAEDSDLFCESCGESFMLVHRVAVSKADARKWVDGETDSLAFNLHLKCPAGCESPDDEDKCYYFKIVPRVSDERGIALTGYPAIAGATAGATPYGWADEPPTDTKKDE